MILSFASFDLRLVRGILPLLIVALLVGGCDDEQLLAPPPGPGAMFDRYAAVGNSITAGFQAGGINATTQQQSYANLLAGQVGTTFNLPALNEPGCPPPLQNLLPPSRGTGPDGAPLTGGDCFLRETPTPVVLNNVAVPNAEVIDVLSNTDQASNANALTSFILGGRTQIEAAQEVQPTFMTVWIGNNDVLDAALTGNPQLITSRPNFVDRYADILTQMENMEDLEGAALFGVVDVTLIPYLSPGAAYAQLVPVAQQAQVLPPNLEIADACAPSAQGGVGDRMLVPFQYGVTLVGVANTLFQFAQQTGQAPAEVTLDCAQDLTVEQVVAQTDIPPSIESQIQDAIDPVRNISLLQTQEIAAVKEAVQAYNGFIQQQAGERDYAFVDVNEVFQRQELQQQIPAFPELFEIPQTPWGPDQPFGPLFSLDGIHPSADAHEIVTNAAIEAINSQYDASIPRLEQ